MLEKMKMLVEEISIADVAAAFVNGSPNASIATVVGKAVVMELAENVTGEEYDNLLEMFGGVYDHFTEEDEKELNKIKSK